MSLQQLADKYSRAASQTGLLLVVIHLFIAVSYTFFLHIHTLDNGQKIVHSHPYASGDESGNTQHQHNCSVFKILPDLSNSINQSPDICLIITETTTIISGGNKTLQYHKCSVYRRHRGPPLFVS